MIDTSPYGWAGAKVRNSIAIYQVGNLGKPPKKSEVF